MEGSLQLPDRPGREGRGRRRGHLLEGVQVGQHSRADAVVDVPGDQQPACTGGGEKRLWSGRNASVLEKGVEKRLRTGTARKECETSTRFSVAREGQAFLRTAVAGEELEEDAAVLVPGAHVGPADALR